MITYLASAYRRKGEIRGYREELKRYGHVVQASWLDEPDQYDYQTVENDPALGATFARKALFDIAGSRRIIVFTGDIGRGGNQLEQGFAMGLGLEVVIVGPNANLFSLLANRQFATWEAFLADEFGIEKDEEPDATMYGRDLDDNL